MLKDIDETLNWDAVVVLVWKNYQKKVYLHTHQKLEIYTPSTLLLLSNTGSKYSY